MTILLTGAAGFIGYHVAEALLARGDSVVGLDNLNSYYDPELKRARLARLQGRPGFVFEQIDTAARDDVFALVGRHPQVDRVVHLAAQAGVRHSLEDPYSYIDANVMGQLVMLGGALRLPSCRHFVYASSSSVYGGNDKLPFAVGDPVDRPVSVYAASKRAAELLAITYSGLHGLPCTGLRFFTVYGPWGRPDMAYYAFTRSILAGEPIQVFNRGRMRRDFTYVDDVVAGVLAALDRPPATGSDDGPHRLYNLGNNRPEPLLRFIEILERLCGRQAVKEFSEMQPGDVRETYAEISDSTRDLDFAPRTGLDEGLARFVAWFRDHHGL